MAQVALRVRSPSTAPTGARREHWSWGQYLALIGLPILVLEVWTVAAWLMDGPFQITQYRDKDAPSWYAARVYELVAIVVFVGMAVIVIRGCIRARKFTLDAHFVLVGMTIFWADPSVNFFGPTWLTSSNWVNLNNPAGHMPFVINPDIGRLPDPLLFTVPLESVGLLAAAMALGAYVRRVRARRPGISNTRIIWRLIGIAFVVECLVELPLVALGLWTYTAPSWMSLPLGAGHMRFPLVEFIGGTFFFLLPALIRIFKDDQGKTICERGLSRYAGLRRHVLTFLSLYGAIQLIMWLPATIPVVAYGPYQEPWPAFPRHLVNGICDAPGWEGTRYGPCPGSPGYRMPGRGSLEGEAP